MKKLALIATAAALVHALAWLAEFGLDASLSTNYSCSFFGTPIRHGTAMNIVGLILLAMFLSGLVVVGCATIAAAGLIGHWLNQPRRDRHGPQNPCRQCGYELRGNLSGVCPECGSPVSAPASPPM